MATREDLSGRKYGEWTVLRYAGNKKYTCQCSCGKIKDVAAQSLRNGASTSCGHKSQEDLTGRHFGEWTVLRYAGDKSWECQCSCGVIKNVRTFHLINNQSTSCGHTNKRLNNLVGQHFGEWDVLEYLGNRYYRCRCSCGVIKDVMGYSLTSGKSKSCGHDTSLFKDETGNVYGELTVLKYLGEHKWECKCSCGKIVQVMGKYLRAGRITSCGHSKLNDLTGKQFGYWTVNKYAGNLYWDCTCICREKRRVLGEALRSGRSTSCGCGGKNVKDNFRKTMLERHNEVSMHRANNPREKWQIEALDNKDELTNLIIKATSDEKPLLTDIAKTLDVSPMTMARVISKFSLEGLINESSYYSSNKEEQLYNYIKSIYSGDIQRHNRSIIYPLELDIYVPDKNIAFEFNGTYWHSEINKDTNYHISKTNKCRSKGIRLIHIFEYEWDSYRAKIQNYIRDLLVDGKVIYARDTVLNEVNIDECSKFLDENHLQGNVNSSIRLGLYSNNELIGIMAFSKPRFDSTCEYELIRLSWKNGIRVPGGAEKLFKYFIVKYNPDSIVSYCNISKFTGTVYKKLGFKIKNISAPNYVWTNGINILSRYQTTKEKLLQKGLGTSEQTEKDIMQNLGYYRIFDCGNIIFVWNRSEE